MHTSLGGGHWQTAPLYPGSHWHSEQLQVPLPTTHNALTVNLVQACMYYIYSMHVLAVTQVCVHVWALKASATYNCDRVNAIHSIACTLPLPLQRRPLVSTPHSKLLHSHVSPKYIDPGSCITISEQRGA